MSADRIDVLAVRLDESTLFGELMPTYFIDAVYADGARNIRSTKSRHDAIRIASGIAASFGVRVSGGVQ